MTLYVARPKIVSRETRFTFLRRSFNFTTNSDKILKSNTNGNQVTCFDIIWAVVVTAADHKRLVFVAERGKWASNMNQNPRCWGNTKMMTIVEEDYDDENVVKDYPNFSTKGAHARGGWGAVDHAQDEELSGRAEEGIPVPIPHPWLSSRSSLTSFQRNCTGGWTTGCRGWRQRLPTARTSERELSFLRRRQVGKWISKNVLEMLKASGKELNLLGLGKYYVYGRREDIKYDHKGQDLKREITSVWKWWQFDGCNDDGDTVTRNHQSRNGHSTLRPIEEEERGNKEIYLSTKIVQHALKYFNKIFYF